MIEPFSVSEAHPEHHGGKTSTAVPNYGVNKAVLASEAKQSNYHKKITTRLLRHPALRGMTKQ
jgi:hypothetical protein